MGSEERGLEEYPGRQKLNIEREESRVETDEVRVRRTDGLIEKYARGREYYTESQRGC